LEEEVKNGRFRADLFHRLNTYPLKVPSLNERKEDIPLLAGYFSERIQRRLGLGPVRISVDAVEVLSSYHWPGNVRELENILSRAILKASHEIPKGESIIVYPIHLDVDFKFSPENIRSQGQKQIQTLTDSQTLREAVNEYQKLLIQRAVTKRNGNWSAAARDLGMHRSNLHNLATRLGIRKINR
jgi:anaerobic nitric oxide reductase transcription regulator